VSGTDEEQLDLIVEVLGRSRGMPVAHLQRRLDDRGATLTVPQLTRILLGHPDLFRSTDRNHTSWALSPRPTGTAPTPRRFVDRTPPPRAWQSAALDAWTAADHRGIVQAITGAGKTLVGIIAIRDAAAAGLRSLVLVPTTPLLTQWEQSLLDALPGIRVELAGGGQNAHGAASADVIVSTVQTAAGAIPDDATAGMTLLVADEAHHYAATTFRPVVRAPFARRLGLTATLQRSDGGDLAFLRPVLGDVVFELDYDRALRDGVVAPFDVTLLGVDLAAGEQDEYERLSDEVEHLVEALRPVLGADPAATASDLHGAIVSLAGRGGAGAEHARAYVRTIDEMRELLDASPAKMDALETLVPAMSDSAGTIVFTQTVALAQGATRRLRAKGLTTATLTSEHSHEERRATLNRFASGRVKVLIAPQLLDEGIDVPDADLGIVLSASRTRRQMVQRMGRVIRPKPDGRGARFAIIFGTDTREDPAHGAHSSFLDEVLPLAREIVRP